VKHISRYLAMDLIHQHSSTGCLCQGDDGCGERVSFDDIPEPCELGIRIEQALRGISTTDHSEGVLAFHECGRLGAKLK